MSSGSSKGSWTLLSKKNSKKELTKGPPFLVKSFVCKSKEKTVNGGWRDGRTLEPFQPAPFVGQPASIRTAGQRMPRGESCQGLQLLESICGHDVKQIQEIKHVVI